MDAEELKRHNEYVTNCLQTYNKACEHFGYENPLETFKKLEIPKEIPEETLKWHTDFHKYCEDKYFLYSSGTIRDEMISLSSFVVIDQILAKSLAEYIGNRKVLEIMSGIGCLAKALSDQGVTIHPTDIFEDTYCFNGYQNTFMDVEQMDCVEAIEKYGKDYDILLCYWPRSESPIIEALLAMRRVNPNMVMLYIGEDYEGCCAPNEFFDEAEWIEERRHIHLKNWDGIHDSTYLLK